MGEKLKSNLVTVTYSVALFAALLNIETVLAVIRHTGYLVSPVLLGLLLAFVLNVPVNGIEKLIQRLFKDRKCLSKGKLLRIISVLTTLLCIALIFTLFFTLVIPEIIRTVKSIVALVEAHWPEWIEALRGMNIDTTALSEWINSFDLQQMIDSAASRAGTLIGSIASVATSTVSGVMQFVIGLILAIYVLMDRETLARQSKKLLYANLKLSVADKVCKIAGLVRWSYTKYLSGQCLEALILGLLILIAFLLFGLPYASLVAMATAVCALIPYIGATASCVIAVLLTLLAEPEKALLCLVVYLVIQFIETQFIYPHVVGGTVGLSPLWTLVSILIGGKLFGFVGVIFFIPLTAALHTLVRDDTENKLKKKAVPVDRCL